MLLSRLVKPDKIGLLRTTLRLYSEKPPKKGFFARITDIKEPLVRLISSTGLSDDKDVTRLAAEGGNLVWRSVVFVACLGTLGVDTGPFVTGLGITGFTIGFALKDIATHWLCSIFLLLQKPFKVGEKIRVLHGSVPLEGTVDEIGGRYVTLRDKATGNVVQIPSSIVYNNPTIKLIEKIN